MQTNRTLITKITIPLYIREVKLSNKQRAKYWEWDGVTIKSGNKQLLKKYINPFRKAYIIENNNNITINDIKPQYCLGYFKGDYIFKVKFTDSTEEEFNVLTKSLAKKPTKVFLCEKINDGNSYNFLYKKVIANATQVDKPKIQVINGQNIYNHTASPFTTGKIFDAIKEMYYKKLITIPINIRNKIKNVLNNSYPLQIEMEIFDTVKNFYDNTKEGNGKIWDVGNRADPYMKTFLDFFSKGYKDENGNYLLEPFIKQDDRLHVTSGNNAYFTPISEEENRKLVFHIYKDNRLIFNQYLQNENNT